MQCRVDRATQRRGSDELDLVMVREVVAEDATLLVAKIGQRGVVDDVVGGGEVVEALLMVPLV